MNHPDIVSIDIKRFEQYNEIDTEISRYIQELLNMLIYSIETAHYNKQLLTQNSKE